MEFFAVFAALIPMIIVLVIYFVVIGLCVWFVVMFLKRQKERNDALQDIARQLKYIHANCKKEE